MLGILLRSGSNKSNIESTTGPATGPRLAILVVMIAAFAAFSLAAFSSSSQVSLKFTPNGTGPPSETARPNRGLGIDEGATPNPKPTAGLSACTSLFSCTLVAGGLPSDDFLRTVNSGRGVKLPPPEDLLPPPAGPGNSEGARRPGSLCIRARALLDSSGFDLKAVSFF